MQTIEFQSTVKDNIIRIPERYGRVMDMPVTVVIYGNNRQDSYTDSLQNEDNPASNLYDFFQNSPLRDVDIDLERKYSPVEMRDISL
jgi:hypothetical protein